MNSLIDGVLAVKAHEAAHKFNPLGCVGVAYLVHHGVYYRKSHPVIDNSGGKDIGVAVLPVGSVHGKVVRSLDRYQF